MFRKLLLPVDLVETELTMRSAAAAAKLASAFDAEVRILNVQSLLPVAYLDYAPQDFDAVIKQGLEKELDELAATIALPAGRVSTKLLFGPVYPNTLDEARDWGADVIIVGSHNPGLERFLIGSNAEAIVSHAHCSVFVVRG